jgi:hypothetical protein
MSKEEAWALVRSDYAAVTEKLGRWPELLDVVYGPWAQQSTSSMAREIDPLLETFFQRASDSAHGSWRSIEKFHLSRCANPLHPAHYVPPSGPRRSAGIIPCISALLQCVDLLLAIYAYAGISGRGVDQMQATRADLRTWITNHQSQVGIFDWEDVAE